MKYLISLILSLFLMFSVYPKAYAAEAGNRVTVVYICKDLDALMKVAEADVESSNKARALMDIEGIRGACIGILPAVFPVHSIILEYKDSDGLRTQLIELKIDSKSYYFFFLPQNGKEGSY